MEALTTFNNNLNSCTFLYISLAASRYFFFLESWGSRKNPLWFFSHIAQHAKGLNSVRGDVSWFSFWVGRFRHEHGHEIDTFHPIGDVVTLSLASFTPMATGIQRCEWSVPMTWGHLRPEAWRLRLNLNPGESCFAHIVNLHPLRKDKAGHSRGQ